MLRECQNEMKMGEMLMSKNFTFLEKAMSAMKLIDPQICTHFFTLFFIFYTNILTHIL